MPRKVPRQYPFADGLDTLSVEDEKFDRVYPAKIRQLSSIFWTPIAVAAEATRLLVHAPGTRVLDLGCGAGKFCLAAATLSEAHLTGIEQRAELVVAARAAAAAMKLADIEFIEGNLINLNFGNYDAFYLFNPFEENLHGHKIDSAIPLSSALFKHYAHHVADQLGARPLGTRVVTYMGYADDIPSCYECEETRFGDDLKLWIKTRAHDPQLVRLKLQSARSYRGASGWVGPRRNMPRL